MTGALTVLAMVTALGGCARATAWERAAGDAARQAVRKTFGPPVMLVPRPPSPPVIDGTPDEPAWRAAEPVLLGYVFDGWDRPSQKTVARVLADRDAVYVAVRCFEAHPEQMRTVGRGELSVRNRGDTVELFLDPHHDGTFRYYDRRHDYYHVIVGPDGTAFCRGGPEYGKWQPRIQAEAGRFDGGWAVEVAVPMADLGLSPGTMPDVWGLNVCRQRPELGVVRPRAARGKGRARFHPPIRPLDDPDAYRDGEYSAWAPTWDDYSYPDAMPFHHPEYFGHALLEVGAKRTPRPEQVFELVYRSEFDDGEIGPWRVWRPGRPEGRPVLVDRSFRGRGKSIAARGAGRHTLRLDTPLTDLEDATLIVTFRMKENGRLYYYGRAPDNKQCGAHRHEMFLTPEAAARRKAIRRAGYSLFPPLNVYHTHADFAAWKPLGRLWSAPGGWALMSGYFSEPSVGSVMWPGTDWCILRTRLGLFRRYHGPDRGQRLVPRHQGYPAGLTFAPGDRGLLISDVVIFRGHDAEPPRPVTGLSLARKDGKLVIAWDRAEDNTLAAYYRVYAGSDLVAETHRLSATLGADAVGGRPLTVVACDLYDNCSAPSAPVE